MARRKPTSARGARGCEGVESEYTGHRSGDVRGDARERAASGAVPACEPVTLACGEGHADADRHTECAVRAERRSCERARERAAATCTYAVSERARGTQWLPRESVPRLWASTRRLALAPAPSSGRHTLGQRYEEGLSLRSDAALRAAPRGSARPLLTLASVLPTKHASGDTLLGHPRKLWN